MGKKTVRLSEQLWRFFTQIKLRKGHRSIEQTIRMLMDELDLNDEDIQRAMEEAGFE